MKILPIPVPEALPQSLRMSDEEFSNELRMLLGVKLYELGKASAGMAAEVAGLDRLSFLSQLSRYGVPAINLRGEEVTHEINAARELAEG
jgi:predicted HTH domain antitoxin